MTTKQWLKQGWNLQKEVEALQNAKRQAFYTACNSTGILSNVPSKSSGNATENKMCNYVDYSQLLDNRLQELYHIKSEILTAILKVENSTYRTLLTERYINLKKWEEIAGVMGYSTEHLRKYIHSQALHTLGEKCNTRVDIL